MLRSNIIRGLLTNTRDKGLNPDDLPVCYVRSSIFNVLAQACEIVLKI